jgi:hypothetical protein
MIARPAAELPADIHTLTARINAPESEITTLVKPMCPGPCSPCPVSPGRPQRKSSEKPRTSPGSGS